MNKIHRYINNQKFKRSYRRSLICWTISNQFTGTSKSRKLNNPLWEQTKTSFLHRKPKRNAHFWTCQFKLVVIHCHSLFHSLSLVVIHCTSPCHLLSQNLSLICLFINDSRKTSKDHMKIFACGLINECSGVIENV